MKRQQISCVCLCPAKKKVPLEINMLGMREHRHYNIPNFEFFKIGARHNCDIILGCCDAHEPKGVCDLESAKTALEVVAASLV